METFLPFLFAFLVGGSFCVIAQLLLDLTRLSPAVVLVLYVTAGVFLSSLGLYEPLRSFAGCGATVPLVGFGGTIAEGIRKAVDMQGLLGVLSGGLTAASAGTAAALIFGYLSAVFFRSRPKRL